MVDTFPNYTYSTCVMGEHQQTNRGRWVRRATAGQRKIAATLALGVAVLFFGLWLLQRHGFDFGLLFNPCGMKQRMGLPCPACGMTTSVLAFARGDIVTAFYVQPAAAFLNSLLVLGAFFAVLIAVSGVYWIALDRLRAEIRVRHLVVGLFIILAAGWAVTMARAVVAQT
jgi:hypothetical protein